jgi:hypothetical protein
MHLWKDEQKVGRAATVFFFSLHRTPRNLVEAVISLNTNLVVPSSNLRPSTGFSEFLHGISHSLHKDAGRLFLPGPQQHILIFV